MPSTSPYQNNDYQAVSSYRPFKLPINDIFKANVAIDAFWKDGARRVKKAYENVLDLKLRTTDNKQIRDQFIQDAQKQITKISSMDLSNPDIQRQGQNIFSPIMKDEDIVGEDYVIRNGEQELSIGEGFRTTDGGKNYNPISISNIQKEQNLLSKDPVFGGLNKRDGWRTIAPIQSKYTPYTDISKERKQIMDTLTASELNTAALSGNQQYIEEIKKKGVSKDKILNAMETMGSPQLKAQMAVEARNVLYNKLESNPASVDTYFKGLGTAYFDNKVGELQNSINQIKYDTYMIPTNSTDPAAKAANLQRIKTNEEGITKIQESIVDILTKQKPEYLQSLNGLGDINNLSSSIPKVEQLWQQSSLDQMASSMSYESSTYNIKANPIWIADQNIKLGVEKLKLDAQEFEYKKVNDARNYELEKWKAENPKGSGTGTNDGEIFLGGGKGNLVDVNYPDPAKMNADDFRKLAQQGIDARLNKDEPIREIAVTNLLGGDAWIGIQENLTTGKKIGDGVLHDFEIEDAAKFMEAYSAKYDNVVNGMFIPKNTTVDEYKEIISNMNPKQFKEMIGNMTTVDSDFVADIAGKWATEKSGNIKDGRETSAKFRAAYQTRSAEQINTSNQILDETSKKLGEYAQFFDKQGKVLMTEGEINAAWQKGIRDNKLVAYYEPVYEGYRAQSQGTPSGFRQVSKEEWDKNTDTLKKIRVPSYQDFKKEVQKRTDPIYYNSIIENNRFGKQYTFDKNDPEKKTQVINYVATQLPTLQGADANQDDVTIFDYIQRHPEEVTSYEIKKASINQPTPMVRFKMKEPSTKADEETKATAKNVNAKWFPVNGLSEEFYKTDNSSSGMARLSGAIVAIAPAKIDGYPDAGITIKNASRAAGVINPHIDVRNLYTYINGKATPVTQGNVEEAYRKFAGTSIQLDLQSNLERVNKFLAAFVTDVEELNRIDKKLQEEKNK